MRRVAPPSRVRRRLRSVEPVENGRNNWRWNWWFPAFGLAVSMIVFTWWTADAIFDGDSLGSAVRFCLGIAVCSYFLLVHRLTMLRRRLGG